MVEMWRSVRKEDSLLAVTAFGFVGFEFFQHTLRPVGDRKMPGLIRTSAWATRTCHLPTAKRFDHAGLTMLQSADMLRPTALADSRGETNVVRYSRKPQLWKQHTRQTTCVTRAALADLWHTVYTPLSTPLAWPTSRSPPPARRCARKCSFRSPRSPSRVLPEPLACGG